jgi:4-diphosphocytidyl-2C-methyl-D-erythritol kinase
MKEKAYAKINLFLNVEGKRHDGYHDLLMVMAPLKLHDVVTFKNLKEPGVQIESNIEITQDIKDNLVYKVARYIQKEFNINKGVKIIIDKNIPIAAGLAGGSADAAATIRGLNRLWKLDMTNEEMAELGSFFGSDVPFCIYNKLALVQGKGEKLSFFNTSLKGHILLVNPNIPVFTKEVFQSVSIEQIKTKSVSGIEYAIQHRDLDSVINELYNSLEQVTFQLHPQVRDLKDDLSSIYKRGVLMSGSGSTMFVLANKKKDLKKFTHQLQEDHYYTLTKIG